MVRDGVLLAAAAGVLGALVTMTQPLELSSVDYEGRPIPCGRGFHAVHDVSAALDRLNLERHIAGVSGYLATDYAAQCDELVAYRRAASAVSGTVGVATMTVWGALSLRRRRTYSPSAPAAGLSGSYGSVDDLWDRARIAGAYTSLSANGHNEIR